LSHTSSKLRSASSRGSWDSSLHYLPSSSNNDATRGTTQQRNWTTAHYTPSDTKQKMIVNGRENVNVFSIYSGTKSWTRSTFFFYIFQFEERRMYSKALSILQSAVQCLTPVDSWKTPPLSLYVIVRHWPLAKISGTRFHQSINAFFEPRKLSSEPLA
jgi:hypothetical protein